MRCKMCGAEISYGDFCVNCGRENDAGESPNVQVLTPAERNAYRGITIDESGEDPGETWVRFERRRRSGVSFMSDGWKGKLAIFLGVAAILAFVFFIALPLALAMVILGILYWIFSSLLS